MKIDFHFTFARCNPIANKAAKIPLLRKNPSKQKLCGVSLWWATTLSNAFQKIWREKSTKWKLNKSKYKKNFQIRWKCRITRYSARFLRPMSWETRHGIQSIGRRVEKMNSSSKITSGNKVRKRSKYRVRVAPERPSRGKPGSSKVVRVAGDTRARRYRRLFQADSEITFELTRSAFWTVIHRWVRKVLAHGWTITTWMWKVSPPP